MVPASDATAVGVDTGSDATAAPAPTGHPGTGVTVAICTLRAGTDLSRAVASVLPQLDDDSELLIVRSGTSDVSLPPSIPVSDPRVRVVAEPRQASATARSTALRTARRGVVLFLDDDCEAEPGWVAALSAAVSPSSVGAAGGTIWPRWPGRRPAWLHPRLASSYGERLAGATLHEPFGANMALRVEAVESSGGVDLRLGHRDGVPGLHEETELVVRLRDRGYDVVEAPGAVVHHRVRRDQVTRRWLVRRCWHEGRSDALVHCRQGHEERVLRALKLAGLIAVALPAQLSRRRGTYVLARIAVNLGYLAELSRSRSAGTGQ